ncbi:PulJ/GspJ family protein [Lichenifustis flavocetrariae]|uniref:Uncharacterized protein n=1 Tax=Lichenifustis flavocetrariae TaxID=2949735 RepID=A0AA41YUI9_9HYPH|nr:hypothetical protein [Lichenifustis flavocetrariae]MCW6508826.1 hypothetical protein [Lichenifustis flavocetrariae]
MRMPRRGEAGFLLADMLATFTISAFVLIGLTAIGAVLLRTADRSVARVAATDDLGRNLITLAQSIRSAARARFAGVEPQSFVFNGDSHRLTFALPDTTPGHPQITRVVTLRSEADGRLLRADAPLPASATALADLHFSTPHLTYAGPIRFRFGYAGPRVGAAPAVRSSVWPVGPQMPGSVSIEAVDPATNHVVASVQVSLVANAEVGCLNGGFCGRSDMPSKSPASPGPAAAAPIARQL